MDFEDYWNFSKQIHNICKKYDFNYADIPVGMLSYMLITNDISILEDYILLGVGIPKNSSPSFKGYSNPKYRAATDVVKVEK